MSSMTENGDANAARGEDPARVLVVDDDDELRSLLVEVLLDAGYAVTEARGGHEAVTEALRVEPHVMLIDLRLPGQSGVEVHEEVRGRGLRMPTVLMSAAHTVGDVAAAHGIPAFLQKPFGIRELLATVAKVHTQPDGATPAVPVPLPPPPSAPVISAAQQLRAMHALAADLASALTLEEVRVAISRWTQDCVGAQICSLALVRGDGMELVEATGVPRETMALWRSFSPAGPLPIPHAIRQGTPIFLETQEDMLSRFPTLPDLAPMLASMHAAAVLPMRAPSKDVIGALGLGFQEPRAFDAESRAFLQALAQQCAIAVERARLYVAEQTRRHEAEAAERRRAVLDEMARLLNRTQLDLPQTFRLVVEQVAEAIGDVCVLRRIAADEQTLEVVALHHVTPRALALARALFASVPQPVDEGLSGKVIRNKRGVLLPVIDPEVARSHARAMYQSYLEHVGMHSLIVVPLVVRDRVLGTLAVSRDQAGRPYTAEDLHFLEAVADRAAWAIENARLHDLAERSARAREQALARVSHDLRSPINVLRLCAELIQVEPAQAGNVARRLERTADQMLNLLDELQRAVKDPAGRATPLERTSRGVADLVRHTIHLVEPFAVARQLTLTQDIDPSLHVSCNPTRIERVLGNLLGNAIQHTPGGGTVQVWAEPRGDEVCVGVTDTGPGVPVEYRQRIFEPYWSKSPDGSRQGSGLGLAIAKEIVEEHGGRLWLESSEGTGSTFCFTLPAAKSPAAGEDP
jgi:signal transduction histidine kinase/DNA-binding response OmpR family regulator